MIVGILAHIGAAVLIADFLTSFGIKPFGTDDSGLVQTDNQSESAKYLRLLWALLVALYSYAKHKQGLAKLNAIGEYFTQLTSPNERSEDKA